MVTDNSKPKNKFKPKFKDILLDENDLEKEVELQIKNHREIIALFLIHSYIENFLLGRYIILHKKGKIHPKIFHEVKRTSFYHLLNIHYVLGNIDKELYDKLKRFSEPRNTYIHDLANIDLKNRDNMKDIKENIEVGLKLCREISKITFLFEKKKQNVIK